MINIETQIQKDLSTGEILFYINSKHLKENIEYINNNKIEHIILNPLIGSYELDDCDFLQSTPHITKIDIVNNNINLQGLLYLKKLQDLYLNVNKKQNLNLSSFDLQKINFNWFKGITSLESNKHLTEITIRGADEICLTNSVFSNFKNLKKLNLVQSKLPNNLEFIKNNINLEELEIHYCKTPIFLTLLDEYAKQLKTLKITHAKKVENINTISKMHSLRWLEFVDSIQLESPTLIEKLPNLESVVVLGSSYFKDGDLRRLKQKLKHLGIDNKKHYMLS